MDGAMPRTRLLTPCPVVSLRRPTFPFRTTFKNHPTFQKSSPIIVPYHSHTHIHMAVNEEKRRRRRDQDYASESAGEEEHRYRPRSEIARRSVDVVGNQLNRTSGEVAGTAQGLTQTAGQTMANVSGSALATTESGKKDTLRLRLDLNLDLEVTLKARIHGDL